MSSEQQDQAQLILHNKEVSQLLCLASLDIKQTKTSIMKVNITEALDLLHKSTDQIDMRLYGNIIFAIAKGIHKKYTIINGDLKDIIDMIRRAGQKKVRGTPPEKSTKKKKVNINLMPSTEQSEETSETSIEQPRHVSSKDKITIADRFTPIHRKDLDVSGESLDIQKNFLEDLSDLENRGMDLASEPGKSATRDLLFGDQGAFDLGFDTRQFEMSTPSRIGDIISPAKNMEVIENLDEYYENYKKAGDIIFEEIEDQEQEEEEPELDRQRKQRRRDGKTADIRNRWDYDEKINIAKKTKELEKSDHKHFIEKVRAVEKSAQKPEKEVVLVLEHFIEGLDFADVSNLVERFSKLGTEPQHALAEIADEKAYESHLPDYFQAFEERGIEVPAGYEEEPFQDQPFYVPEPKDDQILADLTNLDESRISTRRDIREEEERRLRESEETFKKIQDLIKAQKGTKKPVTFDQVAGKANKKAKASAFYDALLLAKQDKITMKQKKPFTDIEIVVN